ncbi:hypothetical protein CWE15_04425 [Aliidiomarina taiwanensis]|uniref:Nucleoid-associated protein n=1 Tax=Aliidiomarina taiwanensis TaxID=946228 RepID=A0A432X736_9GAMM|nr:hypothetical protein [Aliidiomarina taiwanensis]RUO42664.1 hypothetical protein CWE15_04425 [Aliidiomarina taiwanensis]
MTNTPNVEKTHFEVLHGIGFEFSLKPQAQRRTGQSKWNMTPGMPWINTDEGTITFTQKLHQAFNNKAKNYATTCSGLETNHSIASTLKSLLKGAPISSDYFRSKITRFMTLSLGSQLKSSQMHDGFIVSIVMYQTSELNDGVLVSETTKRFLNTSMIRNTDALKFDSHCRIETIEAVDFSKLIQSAMINIDTLERNFTRQQDEYKNETSLIANNGQLRDYFAKGLNADNYIKDSVAANNLVDGLLSFCRSKLDVTRPEEVSIREKFYALLSQDKFKDGISIERVQSFVDTLIPEEKREELQGSFIGYLAEHEYQVNDKVLFSKEIKEKLVWVTLEINDAISVRSKKNKIGIAGSGADIEFDPNGNFLRTNQVIQDAKTIEKILEIIEATNDD